MNEQQNKFNFKKEVKSLSYSFGYFIFAIFASIYAATTFDHVIFCSFIFILTSISGGLFLNNLSNFTYRKELDNILTILRSNRKI